MIYLLLNLMSAQAAFIYLEDKIYQQFGRQIMDSSKLKKSYYYYDTTICGDLESTNFNLGFWFQFKVSLKPQILLQTQFFAISMDLNLIYVYQSDSQTQQYAVGLDQTNWLFFSFQQSGQIHIVYLYDSQQNQEKFDVEFFGYSTFLSLFETNIQTFDGWQGQAEQLRLITEVNFQGRDYNDYLTYSTLQLKTLLLLEFEEKKQTKLLKDKSNFDYEVILGGSYEIKIDADDPILDLSDQSFKFESSKFLTIPNFFLPSTFTIQFKLGLPDLNIPQFTLLTLEQKEIDLLIVDYLDDGFLRIILGSSSITVPLDITQNHLLIQIFFVEIFDELNGNSLWCKLYQIGSDGLVLTSADNLFPFVNLNQKYSQKLLIGHQNNNISGSYFKLYEVKISQGVFYMENNYVPNCLLFVDSRCEICYTPYLVDYDGTCKSYCSNNYIFNSFHNKCIKKCHTLCETCLDTDPTQCIACAGDRANPPNCGCISGFEDYVSPTCKKYLKDISVQVGIIEGTCTPPSNTLTQLFQQPYQTTPKVILSLIGLYESLNQKKFAVYNSIIAADSFEITTVCDKDIYFRIQWMSGISKNFIDSIVQYRYIDYISYMQGVPWRFGNRQFDTFIGWEYSDDHPQQYIRQLYDGRQTHIYAMYLRNLTYQTFVYANFQFINIENLIYSTNERTENYFETSGAKIKQNFDIPECLDYFYFLWWLEGVNGIKFIIKANITTSHQLEITKIQQGNDYHYLDKFTIFILATQCLTELCDYYYQMNDQFNPISLSSICQKGYFSDGQTCEQCNINCYECSDNASTCVSCLASQHKQLDSSTSTCICIDGDSAQYLTLSPTGSSCQCIDRMEFDENQECVCAQGYYDSAGECLDCDSKCKKCEINSTNCTSCNSNLIVVSGVCQCQTNQYLDDLNICRNCDATCFTCESSSNNCTTCDANSTHRELDTQNQCVCKQGYLEVNEIICAPTCHQKCLTCFDFFEYNCLSCDTQLYRILKDNQCICDDGFIESTNDPLFCICQNGYYFENNHCLKCSKSCLTCSEYIQCTSCPLDSTKILRNYQCVCQDQYWMKEIDSDCISCDEDDGWLNEQCIKRNCEDRLFTFGEQCDDGNDDPRDGCDHCVRMQGYTCHNEPLQQSVCSKCGNSCKECLLDGQCILCDEGSQLQDGYCQKCQENCLICKESQCFKCLVVPKFISEFLSQDQQRQCPLCEDIDGLYTNSDGTDCVAICGDQIMVVNAGEQCDDGNNIDYDGCSSTCQLELGFECLGTQCKANYPPIPILSEIQPLEQTNQRVFKLSYDTILMEYVNVTNHLSFQIDNKVVGKDYKVSLAEKQKNPYVLEITLELLSSLFNDEFQIFFQNHEQIIDNNGLSQVDKIIIVDISGFQFVSENMKQATEQVGSFNEYILYILLGMVGLAILLGGIDAFWNLLDLIEILSYIQFIDTIYPYNLDIFLKLFQFGQLRFLDDLIKVQSLIAISFDLVELESYQPKGIFAKYIDSSLFILNIQSTVTAFVIAFGLYIASSFLIKILTKFSNYFQKRRVLQYKTNKLILYLKTLIFGFIGKYEKQFFWNVLIRTHMSTAYDISFAILLQLQYGYIDMQSSFAKGSYIVCCITMVLQIIIVFFYTSKVNISVSQLKQIQFNNNFGESIFETLEVKQLGKLKTYYNVFVLIKRFMHILFLIYFYRVPIIQVTSIGLLQISQIMFLILLNPLKENVEHIKQLLCEILVYILHFKIFILTIDDQVQLLSQNGRILIGWFCIGDITLMMVTQLLIDIIQQTRHLSNKIKKIYQKFIVKNDKIIQKSEQCDSNLNEIFPA